MAPQACEPTLGQLLHQARDVQGLSLRQVAARLQRADGRPISPKYLQLLEQDRRRPSLPLADQLARTLALDTVTLLTLAHLTEALVRRYLQAWPEAELGLIEMLLQAEQRGFVAWDRVTQQLIAPAAPTAPGQRPRRPRGQRRRP